MFFYLVIISIFLIVVYIYRVCNDDFFTKRKIPFERPLPIFGNTWRLFSQNANFFQYYDRYYQKGKSLGLYGIFEMKRKPIVVCDPEIIKSFAIKDFDHFTDHTQFGVGDDIFSRSLFSLKGDHWRKLRAILSPAFTSNKMRIMFGLIEKCASNIDKFLQKKEKQLNDEGKQGVIKEEMKNLFSRFANDAVASAAFGIEVDSLNDPENEFYLMGKDFTDVSGGFRWIKMFLSEIFPKLFELFYKDGIFSSKAVTYFKSLFTDNINKRKSENIHRPDMIHLMLEASMDGKNSELLSHEHMMAQALLFFFAGFDTLSDTLSILVHHLATYPDVQNKLCDEIDDILDKYKNKITFEILMKEMVYMDLVIKESQRMQTVNIFLDRICVKRYTFPKNEKRPYDITIEPEHQLLIPIHSIHKDSEYFSDPDCFIPERFSEENKKSIDPYAFLPFGVGPRICIANRFALMEIKLAIFYLLKNFKVRFIEETHHPIEFSIRGFGLQNKHGYWLGFEKRKTEYV